MKLRNALRRIRVDVKRCIGIEPRVEVRKKLPLEYHGSSTCFWAIPKRCISVNPTVVDFGLGEDVSFSESILGAYGGKVYGFDPTPKSIDFVETKQIANFELFKKGLGKAAGFTEFFLPLNENHVSGSLYKVEHVGGAALQVELVSIREVFDITGTAWIDILKLDIEGAEFEVIMDDDLLG
jgi:FkbM family methyltransferase